MAGPRAPRRGRRGARARLGGARPRRAPRPGCCAAGWRPDEVGDAVRRTGARIVHAHNLNPAFGWRALAAARAAGARVVLHLHNYRLVCAVGTCFTRGEDCTRCHGRNTLPGVRLACRGGRGRRRPSTPSPWRSGSGAWRARPTSFVVPSAAARARLRELGAPLAAPGDVVVPPVVRAFADGAARAQGRRYVAGRRPAWRREKGVEVAIDALRAAGSRSWSRRRPRGRRLRATPQVPGPGSRRRTPTPTRSPRRGAFAGRVDDAALAGLRAGRALAVVPSRSAETFGLAAAEAMAAGVPVAASADRRADRAGPATGGARAARRRRRARGGDGRAARRPGGGRARPGRGAPPGRPGGGRPRAWRPCMPRPRLRVRFPFATWPKVRSSRPMDPRQEATERARRPL